MMLQRDANNQHQTSPNQQAAKGEKKHQPEHRERFRSEAKKHQKT
jgi:hypothetical protein